MRRVRSKHGRSRVLFGTCWYWTASNLVTYH